MRLIAHIGAVAILPWHPSPRRRLIVGIVLGIVISVLVMLAGTDGFVR